MANGEARKMGLWMAVALVMGNMIGSGVFLLPASLGPYGGLGVVGWLFSAAGVLLLALVFGRLSRMIPRAGGPYAYTRAGFGDFAGFLVAWGYWVSIWVANAAIAVALVSYLSFFVPVLAQDRGLAAVVGMSAVWLLTWVNVRGVRAAGSVQVATTVLKVAPLLLVGTIGLLYLDGANFRPFNPTGGSAITAVGATAALTLWAFLGFESATVPAEEVRDPRRTIPFATVLGTVVSALIYIASTVAVMGILAPARLSVSNAPFADAAAAVWGDWTAALVAGGAVVSCFGALNGWILLQGRVPFAAARDGVFPGLFARLSRRGTPAIGLVISSALVTLLMAMNYTAALVEQFTFIILLATLTALLPYALSAMAELMLLVHERDRFRGERVAVSSGIAVLAFLFSLWAIAGAGRDVVYWGFLLLMSGVPIYVWVAWRRARAETRGDVIYLAGSGEIPQEGDA